MIKNIVFDLGGVVLLNKPNGILESIELDKDKLDIINDRFFQDWRDVDLGKVTLKEHFDNCNFDFEISKEIEDKITHFYLYRPFNSDIIELIKELKKKNYKLYILSNNNLDTKEYLIKLPLFNYFDGYIFSCDYGLLKPNEEIYNILFNKYQLIPSECFFIDDKEKNIIEAKELGMNGFTYDYRINKIDDLIEEIEKLNH